MCIIEVFYVFDFFMYIILVFLVSQQVYWKDFCEMYYFVLCYDIVDGGEICFYFVKNGLVYVKGEGLVGVYDGVCFFVFWEVIVGCYEVVQIK